MICRPGSCPRHQARKATEAKNDFRRRGVMLMIKRTALIGLTLFSTQQAEDGPLRPLEGYRVEWKKEGAVPRLVSY